MRFTGCSLMDESSQERVYLTRAEIEGLIAEKGITPRTRRGIIFALTLIAVLCVMAEVVLAWIGQSGSDALMAVAASCAGGIAGMAVPQTGG